MLLTIKNDVRYFTLEINLFTNPVINVSQHVLNDYSIKTLCSYIVHILIKKTRFIEIKLSFSHTIYLLLLQLSI